jgi:hypothetical protein
MMVNIKCATAHEHIKMDHVHECKQGFLAVKKNYSTCILFLPSEETKELVNTTVAIKFLSQSTTPTKLLHLTHTIPRTCSRIQVGSDEVIKNGVIIWIYSYIKNMIKVHIS